MADMNASLAVIVRAGRPEAAAIGERFAAAGRLVDVLWADADAERTPPLAHPLLRWHALGADARTLDAPAVAQLAMRCHWWLTSWSRARRNVPCAAHFTGAAAALAHFAVLAKRSGSAYSHTLLSVSVEPVAPAGAARRLGARAGWAARAPSAALDALAEACMRAHAIRHCDACVASRELDLRAALRARACAGPGEVQPLAGPGEAQPLAGPGAAGELGTAARLWAARSQPRALASALEAASAAAGGERARAWSRFTAAAMNAPAERTAASPPRGRHTADGDRRLALSVCIASHDRGPLLRQAVASIHAQLGVHRAAALLRSAVGGRGLLDGATPPPADAPGDVELLVVDDGSTDAQTVRVLAELEADAPDTDAPDADAPDADAGLDGYAPRRPSSAHGGRVRWPVRVHRLARNAYLGAARNAAARLARGEWLLFIDDDNVAKPQMVAAFARAASHSGADVLTCVNHKWASADAPPQPSLRALLDGAGELREEALDGWAVDAAAGSAEAARGEHWVPLGPCAELGAHANCYGDAHALIRRGALESVGGYTVDYGLGLEDWELYARLALRADDERAASDGAGAAGDSLPLHHLVVPSPLYWYRLSRGGGMLARQHAQSEEARAQRLADRLRSLRPFVERERGRSDGGTIGAAVRDARAPPSLEALLLYSEALRPHDARGSVEACAPLVATRWLRAAAELLAGALALALLLRALPACARARARARVRPPRLVDRSA
ncbi:hypothetical protein KFE25_006778 [Diacronema lutheri]|uniref:Glycosyltransferase 2-like domain-containing protein n=1 Tax=Diacronema lutheri TaxID=2081491 RepID=A0A8J5XF79_DIALT|nr:hypothetical protein KFE25_006778 [Diacronema lutheri]